MIMMATTTLTKIMKTSQIIPCRLVFDRPVLANSTKKDHRNTPQLGLGNECTVDMGDMLSGCPDYDCYTNSTVRLHFVSVNKSVLD